MALDPRHGGIGDIDARQAGLAGTDSGPVVITLGAASAIARSASPSVIYGALIATPSPASAIARSVSPSVILGPVTITPTPASAIARSAGPSVIPGGLTINLAPVTAVVRSVNPTAIQGAITLQSPVASAVGRAVSPTVTLGPVTIHPAAASAIAKTVSPYVPGDAIVITPEPAKAIARTAGPTVTLGSIIVALSSAAAVGRAVGPSVMLGAVRITPNPATAVAKSVNPLVGSQRIYEAVTARVSLVTDRNHRGTLTITERTSRRIKIELFDESDRPVDGFAITQASLRIIDKTSGTAIRGDTNGENILSAFDNTGKAEILLTAADNRMITTNRRRTSEIHILSLSFQIASRSDSLEIRQETFITILDLRSVT